MSETKPGQTSQETSKENTGLQFERRDIIKGLTAVPAVLLYLWSYYKKKALEKMRSGEIMEELSLRKKAPAVLKNKKPVTSFALGLLAMGGEELKI